MDPEKLQDLEVLLGHSFRDRNFLVNAVSHSSIKSERRPSNERLEFLGDSVLGMLVSERLYRRFPESDEGTLTRIKSQAVSRATLQRVAVAMGLDRYILVGKGVLKREIPASLLGNLFEAIVGAIYLDAGLAATRKFIMRHLRVVIDEIIEDRAEKNYKSMLQHFCQRELGAVPTYRVLRESGPAHSRHFDVAVVISGKEHGRARAASKKEAEQGAARAAMIHHDAIDESPGKPARGAGTILRVGPESKKKKRSRKKRGAAEADPETVPPHTPGTEKKSSRRRGGSRRRGRGGKAAEKPDDKPKASETPASKKKTANKKPAKKRSRRKKKTESKPAAEAPKKAPKKKRSRRKKKKSSGDGGE